MSTSIQPLNRIDLASYDLHSKEALDQTILNLSNIETIFNLVTSRIETKLSNVRSKLKQMEERKEICLKKIDALSNLNVALTIYSPSKYVKPYKFDESSWRCNLFGDLYAKVNIPRVDVNANLQHQNSNQELGKIPDVYSEIIK
jgi:hypothetical protein